MAAQSYFLLKAWVPFFIFQQKKALKILRKFFLFHLKQYFGSWDIQILVIFLTAKTFET